MTIDEPFALGNDNQGAEEIPEAINSLEEGTRLSVGTTQGAVYDIVVGDLDNDGDNDVVTGDADTVAFMQKLRQRT